MTEPTELSQNPTEPHPETTEPLVGLASTLFLPGIIIHHRKSASATLRDSSDIFQDQEKPLWQQPGSEPQCMITFPNCTTGNSS